MDKGRKVGVEHDKLKAEIQDMAQYVAGNVPKLTFFSMAPRHPPTILSAPLMYQLCIEEKWRV